jgi:hypothetical protein
VSLLGALVLATVSCADSRQSSRSTAFQLDLVALLAASPEGCRRCPEAPACRSACAGCLRHIVSQPADTTTLKMFFAANCMRPQRMQHGLQKASPGTVHVMLDAVCGSHHHGFNMLTCMIVLLLMITALRCLVLKHATTHKLLQHEQYTRMHHAAHLQHEADIAGALRPRESVVYGSSFLRVQLRRCSHRFRPAVSQWSLACGWYRQR